MNTMGDGTDFVQRFRGQRRVPHSGDEVLQLRPQRGGERPSQRLQTCGEPAVGR